MLDLAQVQPQVESMADYMAAEAGLLATVVNFSQAPLSREQRSQIVKHLGLEIRELHHPAQVNVDQPLRPQVTQIMFHLVGRMKVERIERVDYIVPASQPAVAHLIALSLGEQVGVIWLKRTLEFPVSFVLGGVE